MPHKRSF